MWRFVYKTGRHRLEVLKEYIKEPGNYLYARSAVTQALINLSVNEPERKQEIAAWFRDVLDYFMANKDDESIADPEFIAVILADLPNLKPYFKPEDIQEFVDNDMVSGSFMGDVEEAIEFFDDDMFLPFDTDLPSQEEFYREAVKNWSYYEGTEEEDVVCMEYPGSEGCKRR